MKQKIAITALASFSPLGSNPKNIWEKYLNSSSEISAKIIGGKEIYVATIPQEEQKIVQNLKEENTLYKSLDKSVLYAILASRNAIKNAGWNSISHFGINIGSSRGATELFEKYHQEFLKSGKTPVLSSPTSTLGNISSWIAHDLQSKGPTISHSITCSTSLHAVLNGVAWLQAGMATHFLVGGSEAPLTPFTIAQMQALKLYSSTKNCEASNMEKTKNSLILGEGAAVCCLEKFPTKSPLAYIEGIGYATDILEHSLSISTEALCFQSSMKMALKNTNLKDIDAIVMHSPGTIKGDLSEYKAITEVFREKIPFLTTNKWKIGHTFGTSGLLSLELAILMIQNNQFIKTPYQKQETTKKTIRKILVNAVGFGGNAVSILVCK